MAAGIPALFVTIDDRELADLEETLAAWPREVPRVISKAMNRAAKKMQSSLVKPVAKQLGMKQKDVRKRVWVAKSKPTDLIIRVAGGNVGWPVVARKAKQTAAGVTLRFAGQKTLLKGAFLATMPNTHKGVFRRKSTWRHKRVTVTSSAGRSGATIFGKAFHGLPIQEQFGPSVVDVAIELDIMDDVLRDGTAVLSKRLVAEADRVLERKRASGS